ncbi:MAG: hypothetical protein COZ06_07115 [Armatimonadetes bacterium CG_4_10_14_3_um_filter_66_18]|nr:hypothetical protein [Armatimonadota bacterium]OIO97658.1 MAG: hypothetical protein AUJ96_22825 [Armatimonadetes bacterium CG2_30_66_41]PIU91906.1 MAG: hypothetical protein COS65_20290 [Armatimonadetes bacterium CG06_land_8_20_14_3_00_66_21]PIX47619.1 MAG: hypothetical protein COZ57_08130 [Armatimonadetes bacterium CG_4_8_14_3_um_filter_66_20]PIY50861.1 MAG: hypothetical protein COZ06_07115 [Armatimonadetes bacterium CG_4_10_14_3_um_filter_66_18]PIZ29626.1 MAG: hypothetical protein COY42_35
MTPPERKTRYLRDAVPIRLGNLASNLARISTCIAEEGGLPMAFSVIDESKHFIEWTGAEVEPDVQPELVRLQVELALWQHRWAGLSLDARAREEVARDARQRSNQVLEWSGLLNQ